MKTLQIIIDRAKNFHIANMTLRKWKLNYDIVRREFWQTIGAIAVVIFFLYLVGGSNCKTTTATEQPAPDDFIEQACREYEAKTGRKIYPTGREYIRSGAIKQGLRTVDEVFGLIEDNAKFMWKDRLVPTTITVKDK